MSSCRATNAKASKRAALRTLEARGLVRVRRVEAVVPGPRATMPTTRTIEVIERVALTDRGRQLLAAVAFAEGVALLAARSIFRSVDVEYVARDGGRRVDDFRSKSDREAVEIAEALRKPGEKIARVVRDGRTTYSLDVERVVAEVKAERVEAIVASAACVESSVPTPDGFPVACKLTSDRIRAEVPAAVRPHSRHACEEYARCPIHRTEEAAPPAPGPGAEPHVVAIETHPIADLLAEAGVVHVERCLVPGAFFRVVLRDGRRGYALIGLDDVLRFRDDFSADVYRNARNIGALRALGVVAVERVVSGSLVRGETAIVRCRHRDGSRGFATLDGEASRFDACADDEDVETVEALLVEEARVLGDVS